MVFENFIQVLNPVLNPLLLLIPNNPRFSAMIGVFIIATIVAFVITLANKLLVDQDRLQFLQKEMKDYQQEMMKAQKSGDPKAHQKRMSKSQFQSRIALSLLIGFYQINRWNLKSPQR